MIHKESIRTLSTTLREHQILVLCEHVSDRPAANHHGHAWCHSRIAIFSCQSVSDANETSDECRGYFTIPERRHPKQTSKILLSWPCTAQQHPTKYTTPACTSLCGLNSCTAVWSPRGKKNSEALRFALALRRATSLLRVTSFLDPGYCGNDLW